MREMSGSSMTSRNFFKITQDEFGQANLLGVSNQILAGDSIKINDNTYDLFPEIYKSVPSTSYTGKTAE